MTASRSARLETSLALGAYFVLAVVFTWPVAASPGELRLLAGSSPFDHLAFLWNFHWLAQSLAAGTSPLSTDGLFFPDRISLMLYTHSFTYSALSLPTQLAVGGDRGLNLAFSATVIASFTTAGLATFALARRQGLSAMGAFLAGVAFAFCASRVTNLPRLHVLSSEFIPLAVLALYWTMEERRWRGPVVLAATLTALAYNSASLLFVTSLGLGILLPFAARGRTPGWGPRLAGAALVSLLLVLPMVPGFVEGLAWDSSAGGHDAQRVMLSLDLTALIWPNANDLFLGSLLPARPMNFLEYYFSFFVGMPVLVLVLAAFCLRDRVARRGAWMALALGGVVLALGPEAKWLESPTGIPLPYTLLEPLLPPLRVTRVPARFIVLTSLALALWAGGGWDALVRRVGFGARQAWVLCALVAGLIAISGTDRFPLATLDGLEPDAAPLAAALEVLPADGAVLDLPYDEHFVRRFAMYQQIAHGRPIFFAAYARAPRTNRAHFASSPLFELVTRPGVNDDDALRAGLAGVDLGRERERLRQAGIGAIVLHHDLYTSLGRRGDPRVRRMLDEGRVIESVLAEAWGAPMRVSAGFYEAVVFRL